MHKMSIPNEINRPILSESTVYFYPQQIKITYSSLEDLKNYLEEIFKQDKTLEEKLKFSKIYIIEVLNSLYQRGVSKVDHTMVITDIVVNRDVFARALENKYQSIFQIKRSKIQRNKLERFKSRLLLAIFIKKNKPIRNFISLIKEKKNIYSDILHKEINIKEHSKIRFVVTNELEEFIINFITRKALLSQGCSVYTLRMYLPIIIELVIFYSKAIALIERNEKVTPEILSIAIKTVDVHYITDAKFIKLLQSKSISNFLEFINL